MLKSRVTALPLAVDLPNLQLDADGDDDYDADDGDGDDGDDDDDDDDDEFAQEMGHGTPFPNLQHKTQQIFNNQSDYNLVDYILNVGRQKNSRVRYLSYSLSWISERQDKHLKFVAKKKKRILDLLSSQSCWGDDSLIAWYLLEPVLGHTRVDRSAGHLTLMKQDRRQQRNNLGPWGHLENKILAFKKKERGLLQDFLWFAFQYQMMI